MTEATTDSSIVEKITAIIDEHVRPYIEMDGGTIEFTRYEDSIVYVRLAGACHGCPSSMVTLKGGVERQIRRRLPDVKGVELEGMEAVEVSDTPVMIAL